jgi:hypothetical protein
MNQDNLDPYNLMNSCYMNSNLLTTRRAAYSRFYRRKMSMFGGSSDSVRVVHRSGFPHPAHGG